MTSEDAGHPNPYSDQYDLSLVVYGSDLDPKGLATKLCRATVADLWQVGDTRGGEERASTSGIRVDIGDASTPPEVNRAVERFLEQEAAFLRAVAEARSPQVRVALVCAMWVYAMASATIALPHELLGRLAQHGIDWEVTGYPCADEEDVDP